MGEKKEKDRPKVKRKEICKCIHNKEALTIFHNQIQ